MHNGTVFVRIREHHSGMGKRTKKARNRTLLASVKKQMAEPRMASSARTEVAILAAAKKSRRKRSPLADAAD